MNDEAGLRTVLVTVKFLDELMGNSSEARLLLEQIIRGEIDRGSERAVDWFKKLDRQGNDLYNAFCFTVENM